MFIEEVSLDSWISSSYQYIGVLYAISIATDHFTLSTNPVTFYVIFIADGDRQRAIYKGKITIKADVDDRVIDIELTNVYYVPGFDINLVSYKKLSVKGVRIEERE